MSFALLLCACALIGFAAVNAACSALVALTWRLRPERWSSWSSHRLLLLRAFPAAFSAAFVAFALVPSFLRHERRDAVEPLTLGLALAALVGLLLVLAAIRRAAVAWWTTRRAVRRWSRSGRPLAVSGWRGTAFRVGDECPGVFVAGVRRPALFLSDKVARACTPAELAAIVAHETAHAAAGDNAKKLALCGLPDFLRFGAVASAIESAWHEAAEEEADARALGPGGASGIELAGAIVKVSRFVRTRRLALLAASSLLQGGPITRRVQRLIDGCAARLPGAAGPRWLPWIAVVALPALWPLLPGGSGRLHAVTEAVVGLLRGF